MVSHIIRCLQNCPFPKKCRHRCARQKISLIWNLPFSKFLNLPPKHSDYSIYMYFRHRIFLLVYSFIHFNMFSTEAYCCNVNFFINSKFRDTNPKFRLNNSRFRLSNPKCRLNNSKFLLSNPKFRLSNSKCRDTNPKFRLRNSKFRINNSKFRLRNSKF